MTTIFPTSVPSKRLSESITGASTSFKVNSIAGWDGSSLTSADFGTKAYAVFRNSAGTLMEIMEIDPSTITSASSAITILLRGLKFTGDLTTEVSANKLTWVKGDTIVEFGTHVPQLLKSFVDIYSAQTVAGVKTFSSTPINTGGNPTAATELATKAYVDLTATGTATTNKMVIAGTAGETITIGQLVYLKTSDSRWWLADADAAGTSENIILGIAQGAGTAGNAITSGVLTQGLDTNQTGLTANTVYYVSNTAGGISTSAGTKEVTVGVATSTTSIHFFPRYNQQLTENQQDMVEAVEAGTDFYAASVVGTDSYAITISPAITAYATGMKFRFKADVANTGGATLAVSGLAAKTILKKNDQALATGDIEAGQIVEVVYDGTNLQMVSETAQTYATAKFGGTGADGALALTSGATNIDLGSAQVVTKNYTSISITGTGSLTFTNPHANGTLVFLKSQGDVTLTSSTAPMIVASSLGATAVTDGSSWIQKTDGGNTGTTGTNGASVGGTATTGLGYILSIAGKVVRVSAGAGGGNGGAGDGGAGGGARGGGGLVIECGGALNFTTASGISVAGATGSAGTGSKSGGGGGGAGGVCAIIYNTLTANSGTITVTGGTGGAGGAGDNTTNGNFGAGGSGGANISAGGAGGAQAGGSAGSGTSAGSGGAQGSSSGGGGGGGGASGESYVTSNTEFA